MKNLLLQEIAFFWEQDFDLFKLLLFEFFCFLTHELYFPLFINSFGFLIFVIVFFLAPWKECLVLYFQALMCSNK